MDRKTDDEALAKENTAKQEFCWKASSAVCFCVMYFGLPGGAPLSAASLCHAFCLNPYI